MYTQWPKLCRKSSLVQNIENIAKRTPRASPEWRMELFTSSSAVEENIFPNSLTNENFFEKNFARKSVMNVFLLWEMQSGISGVRHLASAIFLYMQDNGSISITFEKLFFHTTNEHYEAFHQTHAWEERWQLWPWMPKMTILSSAWCSFSEHSVIRNRNS